MSDLKSYVWTDLYWTHLSFYVILEKEKERTSLSTREEKRGKVTEKGQKAAAGGDSSRLIPMSGSFRPLSGPTAARFYDEISP